MKRSIVVLTLAGAVASVVLFVAPILAAEKGDFAQGESVYKEICFSCHGMKGDGKGPRSLGTMPRPQVFMNTNYMSRLTDQYMFEVIKYGKLAVLKRVHPTTQQIMPMPPFEHTLTDEQIRALVTLERGFLSGAPPSAEAQQLFQANCAVCHGAEGRGNGVMASPVQPALPHFVSRIQPAPADYTDPLFMARFDDAFLFWLIKKGRVGVTEEKAYVTMNAYGQILSVKEIWSVVRYIREHFIQKTR